MLSNPNWKNAGAVGTDFRQLFPFSLAETST